MNETTDQLFRRLVTVAVALTKSACADAVDRGGNEELVAVLKRLAGGELDNVLEVAYTVELVPQVRCRAVLRDRATGEDRGQIFAYEGRLGAPN